MTQPTVWEEAAQQAAVYFFEGHTPLDRRFDSQDRLVTTLGRLIGVEGRALNYSAIADNALALLTLRTDEPPWEALDRIVELITKKQHDYGHGNILKFGHTGLNVRMSDKFERLKNLLKRKAEGKNESVNDTVDDLIGYSIIGHMLNADTFKLPLAEDWGK